MSPSATHWVPDRGRRRGQPYRSRLEAHQSARGVWLCARCRRWHEKGTGGLPLGEKGRPKQCAGERCGSKELLRFDSAKEAQRFAHLLVLQDAGHISGLVHHPRYPLCVLDAASGKPVEFAAYEADSEYRDRDGALVVEDVKGVRDPELEPDAARRAKLREALDPVFRVKRRAFEAAYGVTVRLVS